MDRKEPISGEDAGLFNCPLLGGDTVSTPGPAMISITAFGRVPSGKMVHRSGAGPGDRIVVTGTIGDAALGLDILKGGAVAKALAADAAASEMLVGRYRVPQPRNALAQAVRDHASAAMDVSDGLAGDLAKLCTASAVSAVIDAPGIPLSAPASALLARGTVGIGTLIGGGDDYEILCAIPENRFDAFAAVAGQAGVAVASIGTVIAGSSAPQFLDAQGREIALKHLSYSHFWNSGKKRRSGRKYLPKSTVYALRSVAQEMRFWHGPADLRPPFWAGQAFFLCVRRSRGEAWG